MQCVLCVRGGGKERVMSVGGAVSPGYIVSRKKRNVAMERNTISSLCSLTDCLPSSLALQRRELLDSGGGSAARATMCKGEVG